MDVCYLGDQSIKRVSYPQVEGGGEGEGGSLDVCYLGDQSIKRVSYPHVEELERLNQRCSL